LSCLQHRWRLEYGASLNKLLWRINESSNNATDA
jgi:hypothetical protein